MSYPYMNGEPNPPFRIFTRETDFQDQVPRWPVCQIVQHIRVSIQWLSGTECLYMVSRELSKNRSCPGKIGLLLT
jgi:hypothetical protein